MRDAKKKQQAKKQNPLIISPIALSLAACGAGGDGEVGRWFDPNRRSQIKPISIRFLWAIYF